VEGWHAVEGMASVAEDDGVRVFISYAHDSVGHEDRVREFWLFLRANGIDARLDKPAAERRQDWSLWMLRQVRQAQIHLEETARRARAAVDLTHDQQLRECGGQPGEKQREGDVNADGRA